MKQRMQRMTQADKDYANSLNLEWLRLSNKVLRAFPSSPLQKELIRQRDLIPQYKPNSQNP